MDRFLSPSQKPIHELTRKITKKDNPTGAVSCPVKWKPEESADSLIVSVGVVFPHIGGSDSEPAKKFLQPAEELNAIEKRV